MTGVRFCRLCSQFLPLDRFPKGPVRYICKTHWTAQISECAKRRRLEQLSNNNDGNSTKINKRYGNANQSNTFARSARVTAKKQPLSKLRSISILVDSKDDAKRVFGQEKVCMGLRDVETHVGCNLALRLIPADPLRALSNSNFIICTKEQRRLVTSLWKTKQDPQAYSQLIRLLELSVSTS